MLAAAKAELVASGYEAFSVARVARAAGVQKTTIYRRWRTPLHLIMDVVLATAGEVIPIPDTGDLAVHPQSPWARDAGLLSYGIDVVNIFRSAAAYVAQSQGSIS